VSLGARFGVIATEGAFARICAFFNHLRELKRHLGGLRQFA
jgi:hypothetical protein